MNNREGLCPLNVTSTAPLESEQVEPAELLGRAQRGDAEAFCELCRSYETRLLRQAFVLCRNESLAEELAQDTLIEAWKNIAKFQGKSRFYTWICAILLNRYRNTLRARKSWFWFRASTLGESGDGTETTPDQHPTPAQSLAETEQVQFVQRCIERLPEKHRQVIYLRFFAGDSLEGIAAAIGCSVGTVKSRLFHALEKLRGMKAAAQWWKGTSEL